MFEFSSSVPCGPKKQESANHISDTSLAEAAWNLARLKNAGVPMLAIRETVFELIFAAQDRLRERTLGTELGTMELADELAKLTGQGRDRCNQASLSVVFQSQAQVAAEALRDLAAEHCRPIAGRVGGDQRSRRSRRAAG